MWECESSSAAFFWLLQISQIKEAGLALSFPHRLKTSLSSRQQARALVPFSGEPVAGVTEGQGRIQSVAQILCHVAQQINQLYINSLWQLK